LAGRSEDCEAVAARRRRLAGAKTTGWTGSDLRNSQPTDASKQDSVAATFEEVDGEQSQPALGNDNPFVLEQI